MTTLTEPDPGLSNATMMDNEVAAPGGGSTGRAVFWAGAVLLAAGGFFLWALTWQTGPRETGPPLSLISAVPDFSLIGSHGRPVTKADLLGSVWIADFIFTRCSGPCPELSARMRGMQYELAAEPDVKLVSICLDPENDTPSALVHYGKRFNADPARWWFLTGTDENYVHSLVEKGFLQSVVPASDGSPLMHSTYVVIVDRAGNIRSAHDGVESGMEVKVLRDVRKLLAEPAGT